MKRARTDSKDASDGVRQEKEEEEEVEEEEEEMSPRHAKAARLDEAETAVAGVGLESVGDDALMLIMDWCGLKASVRAFFLANRHLHSLLLRHQGLWRRAYLNLYRGHQKKTKKKTMESDDEESSSSKDTMKKEPMVTVVEDYYAAYVKAMSKWSGSFEFYEDGVPLAESDGDLTIKVDFFGRATWEGYGVGCGRAGEYTSLHCLAGKGKLVLEDKKGEQVAYVVGAEDSKDGRCERVRHYNDDEDEEDDEEDDDDDEDDDNDEKADEEKIKKQREIEARREKKRKEREEAQNYPDRWIELNLAKMRKSSFFFGRVRYDLHVGLLRMGRTPRQRKWCTGGGVCRYWHEDMEW